MLTQKGLETESLPIQQHSAPAEKRESLAKRTQGSTFFGAAGTSSEEELPPKRVPSELQSVQFYVGFNRWEGEGFKAEA